MSYQYTRLSIDGRWHNASDGRTFAVTNPVTCQVIGKVARASVKDLERAAAASKKGFDMWRKMTPAARSPIMRRAAVLMRQRANAIAPSGTIDDGKPFAEAKGQALAAADIIEWFAEEGYGSEEGRKLSKSSSTFAPCPSPPS